MSQIVTFDPISALTVHDMFHATDGGAGFIGISPGIQKGLPPVLAALAAGTSWLRPAPSKNRNARARFWPLVRLNKARPPAALDKTHREHRLCNPGSCVFGVLVSQS
jgi:hypothetical protein